MPRRKKRSSDRTAAALPLTMAGRSTSAAAIYEDGSLRRGEPGEDCERKSLSVSSFICEQLCAFITSAPLLLCVAFARVWVRDGSSRSPRRELTWWERWCSRR